MKRIVFLIVWLLMAFNLVAQQQTDYNRQGDEAMLRLDYSAAKLFYEEGLANCDAYSIDKLTTIWFADTEMRPLMRIVMNKCLNCLTDLAMQSKDTVYMRKLVLYYAEGIGTQINKTKENYWQQQIIALGGSGAPDSGGGKRGVASDKKQQQASKKPKTPSETEFFIGYSASLLAPFGLQAGLTGKSIGFYLRYRTNLSFRSDNGYTCDKEGNVPELSNVSLPSYAGVRKHNSMAVTGGLIIKPSKTFHISFGAGYWDYTSLYQFEKIGIAVSDSEGYIWAKNTDYSYSGLAADLDAIIRIGDTVYLSFGASAFNFKYVYANAGFGIFF